MSSAGPCQLEYNTVGRAREQKGLSVDDPAASDAVEERLVARTYFCYESGG